MSNWDNEPIPEREWAIRELRAATRPACSAAKAAPARASSSCMKNVAHVAGKDWLGLMPEPGPAIYLGAEDDRDELHSRIAAIAKHYGVTFKDLIEGGLHVLACSARTRRFAPLGGKSGKVETTGLYRQLYEMAGDIKPKNIQIDTLSRAFAGNEIDRVQVYAFAHAHAGARDGGRRICNGPRHPSLAGIASGSGISGSTAWHGASGFGQYLKGSQGRGW